MKLKVFGHNGTNRRSSNYRLCFSIIEVLQTVEEFSRFKHIRVYNVESWTCSRCNYKNHTKVSQTKCSYCGFKGRDGHFLINNIKKPVSVDEIMSPSYVEAKYSATRAKIDSNKKK